MNLLFLIVILMIFSFIAGLFVQKKNNILGN